MKHQGHCTVNCTVLCALNSAVCTLQCTVQCSAHCTVQCSAQLSLCSAVACSAGGEHSIVWGMLSQSAQFTVQMVHCTLYTLQCIVQSAHFTRYTLHFTLYSTQRPLYSTQRTLSSTTFRRLFALLKPLVCYLSGGFSGSPPLQEDRTAILHYTVYCQTYRVQCTLY